MNHDEDLGEEGRTRKMRKMRVDDKLIVWPVRLFLLGDFRSFVYFVGI